MLNSMRKTNVSWNESIRKNESMEIIDVIEKVNYSINIRESI